MNIVDHPLAFESAMSWQMQKLGLGNKYEEMMRRFHDDEKKLTEHVLKRKKNLQ